jgi:hypothetical protein
MKRVKLAILMLVCSASLLAASDMPSAQSVAAEPYCGAYFDIGGAFCLAGCEWQSGCDCVTVASFWSKCCCTLAAE